MSSSKPLAKVNVFVKVKDPLGVLNLLKVKKMESTTAQKS